MLNRVAKVTSTYVKQQKPSDVLEENQTALQRVSSKYRALEHENNDR
jgi:hypothetical protein